MSEALGIQTIVEGVETAEQARHLMQLGCRVAQGYLYARPARADQIITSSGCSPGRNPTPCRPNRHRSYRCRCGIPAKFEPAKDPSSRRPSARTPPRRRSASRRRRRTARARRRTGAEQLEAPPGASVPEVKGACQRSAGDRGAREAPPVCARVAQRDEHAYVDNRPLSEELKQSNEALALSLVAALKGDENILRNTPVFAAER